MASLNSFRNSTGKQWITIKEAKKLVFFFHPKIGITHLWVHYIPTIVEFEDRNTGKRIRTISKRRYICPNPAACHFCALKNHIREIVGRDDAVVWDMKEEFKDKLSKFTKLHLVGKATDWKNNFKTEKEVYVGIVDHSDYKVKLLQVSQGTWKLIDKVIKNEEKDFGNAGNPELNPGGYAFIGEYDETAKQAQDFYTVRKSPVVIADDKIKELLNTPVSFDIDKMFTKDHLEDIKRLCLTYSSTDCNYAGVDATKRRGKEGDFNPEDLESEEPETTTASTSKVVMTEVQAQSAPTPVVQPQQPIPVPIVQPQPVVASNGVKTTVKEAAMVAMGERKVAPQVQAVSQVAPQAAPLAPAVKSDDKGTFIECPKCQFKINLEENIDKCPSCGQSIFPF